MTNEILQLATVKEPGWQNLVNLPNVPFKRSVLDLTQAEAVMDNIRAKTDKAKEHCS